MRDHDRHRDRPSQQTFVRAIDRGRVAHDVEVPVGGETVDEAARGRRSIEIHDVDRRIADFERGGVREHEELHDGNDQHLCQQDAVAEDVQDFGLGEVQDAAHVYSRRSLNERMLATSSTAAIAARNSVSRQTYSRPIPFSMMPRAIATNQRPGIT